MELLASAAKLKCLRIDLLHNSKISFLKKITQNSTQMIQKIHELARNQRFLRLHRELNKFNIFHATGMKNQEIKHTQFLGYLLDPNESHGFKDEFLIRFIQSIPTRERAGNVGINILDFNLSYSKVSKEIYFRDAGGQLDLLIEIPSLSLPEKIYVIAIENKIRATQGDNQLQNYRDAINTIYQDKIKGSPILLYLTINNEEPSDDQWMPIIYSETVLKSIKNLIDDLEETLSNYIIFILNDYIELINKEGEYESIDTIEKIASEIDIETINNIKEISTLKSKSIEHQRLETRYKKAINYIARYDNDPRKDLLKHFKYCFDSEGEVKLGNGLKFKLESSNRNWMRFSFLSDENGRKLSEICNNPTRNWLSSLRNLAFEFVLSKPYDDNTVDCRASLILGPTGIEYKKRTELLREIRTVYTDVYNINTEDNSEAQSHFNAIKRGAFKNYNQANLNLEQAKEWIERSLREISEKERVFIERINEAMGIFFKQEETPPPNQPSNQDHQP